MTTRPHKIVVNIHAVLVTNREVQGPVEERLGAKIHIQHTTKLHLVVGLDPLLIYLAIYLARGEDVASIWVQFQQKLDHLFHLEHTVVRDRA